MQKTLTEYSKEMTADGHSLEVVEDDLKPVRSSKYIYRNEYVRVVKTSMEECRARELPGT